MSVPDDTRDQLEEQNLRPQDMDANTAGRYAGLEQVLKEIKKPAQRQEKLPQLVKEIYWSADFLRKRHKYPEAIVLYEQLVNLISDPDNRSKPDDPDSLYYLASAFIYFIECGRHVPEFFLPERQVEVLQRKVEEGIVWLGQVGSSGWAAGLHLQWGLSLKSQKDLKRAQDALTEALRLAQDNPEAPGYPLAIYHLELAELLYDIDAYAEAASHAEKVLSMVSGTTSERKQAKKILTYARVELEAIDIASSSPSEEQKSVPLPESARDAGNQPLGQSHQQIEREAEPIAFPGQSISPSQPQVINWMERLEKMIYDQDKLLRELQTSFKETLADHRIKQMERLSEIQISLKEALADQGIEQRKRLSELQFHITATTVNRDTDTIQAEQPSGMQTHLSVTHPAASQKDKPTDSDNDHPEHITCMVALPFKDDENTFSYNKILLPALQDVLERDPYYWQVSRADERYFEAIIQLNVAVWMERVHAYIVDISDKNPNVMMELGYMLWAKKDRPLIVLSREGTDRQLADLGGYICIPYPATKAGGDSGIDEVVNRLKEELRKHEGIKALNQSKQAHYLSAIFLKKDYGASIEIARSLSQIFTSMEAIEAATDEAFRQRTRAIPEEQADGARKFILRRLKEIRDSQ